MKMLKGKGKSIVAYNAKAAQQSGVKQGDALKQALMAAGRGKPKKAARRVAIGDEVPIKPGFKAKQVQAQAPPIQDEIDPALQ